MRNAVCSAYIYIWSTTIMCFACEALSNTNRKIQHQTQFSHNRDPGEATDSVSGFVGGFVGGFIVDAIISIVVVYISFHLSYSVSQLRSLCIPPAAAWVIIGAR